MLHNQGMSLKNCGLINNPDLILSPGNTQYLQRNTVEHIQSYNHNVMIKTSVARSFYAIYMETSLLCLHTLFTQFGEIMKQ